MAARLPSVASASAGTRQPFQQRRRAPIAAAPDDDSNSDGDHDSPPHTPPESPPRRHSMTTLNNTLGGVSTLTSPGFAGSMVSTHGFLGTRPLLAFDEKRADEQQQRPAAAARLPTRPRPPVESKVKKLWDRPSLSAGNNNGGAVAVPSSGWLPAAKGAQPREDDMDDLDGGFMDDGPDFGDDAPVATSTGSHGAPVVAAIARVAPVVRARENKPTKPRPTRPAARAIGGAIAPLPSKVLKTSSAGKTNRSATAAAPVPASGTTRRGITDSSAAAPLKIVALLNLSDNSVYSSSVVPIAEPLFSATPSQVSFANYVPFQPYSITIALRNKDTVARRVKLEPPSSHHFTLSAPVRAGGGAIDTSGGSGLLSGASKVAPGMDIRYTITFNPGDRNDYQCDLLCTTEREQFIIPVRARGDRAMVDLPSSFDLVAAPVNHSTTRSFLLQNCGPSDTKYAFTCESPVFTISPANGFLSKANNLTVNITFRPLNEGVYRALLSCTLDGGVVQQCQLSATATSVKVHLDQPLLQLPNTFIELSTQGSVRLVNDSDVPIKFSWRSCASATEEEQRAKELHDHMAEGSDDESHTTTTMKVTNHDGDQHDNDDDGSDDDGEIARLRAEQTAARKQKNLARMAAGESTAFWHPHYSITPLSGELWPKGSMEIVTTFNPRESVNYLATAFCEVSGCAQRLPLQLKGHGLGPKAVFSYNTLDITEVFINAVHHYEVVLTNIGAIDARYTIQDFPGSRFKFTPSHGILSVPPNGRGAASRIAGSPIGGPIHDGQVAQSERVTIGVEFTSDSIGEFSETYKCLLQGTVEPLLLTFRGKVVGPTFHFDEKEIDFGMVSYGFTNERSLHLRNTSQIPMKYTLRIPSDHPVEREFILSPPNGVIPPMTMTIIKLAFTSESVQKYESFTLNVDVDGVGRDLICLPIKAECVVAEVALGLPVVEFGECFLRHTYQENVPIVNNTDHSARFHVITQDEASKTVAVLQPGVTTAAIDAHATHDLALSLTAQRLGPINLPLYFRVPGSLNGPILMSVKANAIGPRVKIDRKTLTWLAVAVLKPHTKTVKLTNDSPIRADFKALINNSDSVFSVAPATGSIAPFDSLILTITCNMDETLRMNDALHVRITEGDDLTVKLTATGRGAVMFSETDLTRVDHGAQFTNQVTTRTFTLENKGRRSHVLFWDYLPPAVEEPVDTRTTTRTRAPVKAATTTAARRTGALTTAPKREVKRATAATATGDSKRDGSHESPTAAAAASGDAPVEFKVIDGEHGDDNDADDHDDEPTADGDMTGTAAEKAAQRAAEAAWKELEREKRQRMSRLSAVSAKRRKGADMDDVPPPVFNITPSKVTLAPNQACTFTITGTSERIREVEEEWICRALIGKTNKYEELFYTKICANFIIPLIQFSADNLSFTHMFAPVNPSIATSQPISLKNVSSLPLSFTARTTLPFSIDHNDFELAPGAAAVINVSYSTDSKGDRQSLRVKQSLILSYKDHPQRDRLPLIGQLCYPNLAFDTHLIDFGVTPNEAHKRIVRRITNNSAIEATYEWRFSDEDVDREKKEVKQLRGRTSAATRAVGIASQEQSSVVNHVFDVVPIRGVLQPGASEDIEFVLYGQSDAKVRAVAVCEVVGGPNYEVGLVGEASSVAYRLDRPTDGFDFGLMEMDNVEERDMILVNTCKVPFDFSFNMANVNAAVVNVTPTSGRLQAGERQKITVRFSARLPDRVDESFELTIAYFDPIRILVGGQGVYSQLLVTLPRQKDDVWTQYNGRALESLTRREKEEKERLDRATQAIDALKASSTMVGGKSMGPGSQMGDVASVMSGYPGQSGAAVTNGPAVPWSPSPSGLSLAPPPTAPAPPPGSSQSFRSAMSRQSQRSGRSLGGRATVQLNWKPTPYTAAMLSAAPNLIRDLEADRLMYMDHVLRQIHREKQSADGVTLPSEPIDEDTFAIGASATAGASESKGDDNDTDALNATTTSNGIGLFKIDESSNTGGPPRRSSTDAAIKKDRMELESVTGSEAADTGVTGVGRKRKAFVIQRLACDLGYLALGTSKKKTFRVTNVGGLVTSFDINKRLLMGTVFTVEPMAVQRLAPGDSVDFTLTCATSARRHKEGPVALTIPLAIRNGPEIRVKVKADICVPDVELSMNKLDFGNIYVGQRREITIQLRNTKGVACDWSLRPNVGQLPRDLDAFTAVPAAGIIPPGGRTNVLVAFTPAEQRRSLIRHHIRIALSSRTPTIKMQGNGLNVELQIAPGDIELGPCMPHLTSVPVPISLVNPSDIPIEVYSLDFDRQYRDEDAILGDDDTYVNGVLYAEPRDAGTGLAQVILQRYRKREAHKKRLAERAIVAAASATAAATQALAIANGTGGVPDGVPSIVVGDAATPSVAVTGETKVAAAAGVPTVDILSPSDSSISVIPSVRNILIVGAPSSGQSTTARQVATNLGLAPSQYVTTLDAIVRDLVLLDRRLQVSDDAKKQRAIEREAEREKDRQKEAKLKGVSDRKQLTGGASTASATGGTAAGIAGARSPNGSPRDASPSAAAPSLGGIPVVPAKVDSKFAAKVAAPVKETKEEEKRRRDEEDRVRAENTPDEKELARVTADERIILLELRNKLESHRARVAQHMVDQAEREKLAAAEAKRGGPRRATSNATATAGGAPGTAASRVAGSQSPRRTDGKVPGGSSTTKTGTTSSLPPASSLTGASSPRTTAATAAAAAADRGRPSSRPDSAGRGTTPSPSPPRGATVGASPRTTAAPGARGRRGAATDEWDETRACDFSDCRDAIDEESMSRIIRMHIMRCDGELYRDGIIFDGLESCFYDRDGVARVIRATFDGLSVVRENNLHIIILDASPQEILARLVKQQRDCEALVAADAKNMKRFKPLAVKEAEKLVGDKRVKYDEQLAAFNARNNAEITLERIKTIEQPRLRAYFANKPVAPVASSFDGTATTSSALEDLNATTASVIATPAPYVDPILSLLAIFGVDTDAYALATPVAAAVEEKKSSVSMADDVKFADDKKATTTVIPVMETPKKPSVAAAAATTIATPATVDSKDSKTKDDAKRRAVSPSPSADSSKGDRKEGKSRRAAKDKDAAAAEIRTDQWAIDLLAALVPVVTPVDHEISAIYKWVKIKRFASVPPPADAIVTSAPVIGSAATAGLLVPPASAAIAVTPVIASTPSAGAAAVPVVIPATPIKPTAAAGSVAGSRAQTPLSMLHPTVGSTPSAPVGFAAATAAALATPQPAGTPATSARGSSPVRKPSKGDGKTSKESKAAAREAEEVALAAAAAAALQPVGPADGEWLSGRISEYIKEIFRIEINPADLDPNWTPAPLLLDIIRKPKARRIRAANTQFYYVDRIERSKAVVAAPEPEQVTPGSRRSDSREHKRNTRTGAAAADEKRSGTAVSVVPESVPAIAMDGHTTSEVPIEPEFDYVRSQRTRWIIPAHASVELFVQFCSTSLGRFTNSLGFEVAGAHNHRQLEYPLSCRAICALPEIGHDVKEIFKKRGGRRQAALPTPRSAAVAAAAAGVPGTSTVVAAPRWLVTRNVLEFGALLIGKDPAIRLLPPPEPSPKGSPAKSAATQSTVTPIVTSTGPAPSPTNAGSVLAAAATAAAATAVAAGGVSPTPGSKATANRASAAAIAVAAAAAALANIPPITLKKVNSVTVKKSNSTTMRLTNTGLFPLSLDLSLRDSITSIVDATEQASARGKSKRPPAKTAATGADTKTATGTATPSAASTPTAASAAAAPPKRAAAKRGEKKDDRAPVELRAQPIFRVEPSSLSLQQGESRDIIVWSFPQEVGHFTDALVACIKDNPFPVIWPLSVHGARPTMSLSTPELMFDRLLIGQTDTKSVMLTNTSSVPLAWSLRGIQQLTQEFTISCIAGTIAAGATVPLQFGFKALEQNAFEFQLAIHYSDAEGLVPEMGILPLTLAAEAFHIDTKVDMSQDGLDFKVLRVGERSEQTVTITNDGKYPIKYGFEVAPRSRRLLAELVVIDPPTGELQAGDDQVVKISVRAEREVTIPRMNDLRLQVAEGETQTVVRAVPVPLSLRTVFSKFGIEPAQSTQFGAWETGTRGNRQLRIENKGEFPFTYQIYPADASHPLSKAGLIRPADEKVGSRGVKPKRGDTKDGAATAGAATGEKKERSSKVIDKDKLELEKKAKRNKEREEKKKKDDEKKAKERRDRAIAVANGTYNVAMAPAAPPAKVIEAPKVEVASPKASDSPKKGTRGRAKAAAATSDAPKAADSSPVASDATVTATAPSKTGTRGVPTLTTPSVGGSTGLASPTNKPSTPTPGGRTGGDEKRSTSSDAKKGLPKVGGRREKEEPVATLTLGAFTIAGTKGEIQPGGVAVIELTFDATTKNLYTETLEIDIGDRDMAKDKTILYKLVGEACAPSIDTVDWETIFEEQEIRPRFDSNVRGELHNYFALDQRMFCFAPVLLPTPAEIGAFIPASPAQMGRPLLALPSIATASSTPRGSAAAAAASLAAAAQQQAAAATAAIAAVTAANQAVATAAATNAANAVAAAAATAASTSSSGKPRSGGPTRGTRADAKGPSEKDIQRAEEQAVKAATAAAIAAAAAASAASTAYHETLSQSVPLRPGGIIPEPSAPRGMVVERFRLTNPGKVAATIVLTMEAPGTPDSVMPVAGEDTKKERKGSRATAGGTAAAAVAPVAIIERKSKKDADAQPVTKYGVFQCSPPSITLPPGEHRYATVTFMPTSAMTYGAKFTATVDRGTDAGTRLLSFELRGDGVSPAGDPNQSASTTSILAQVAAALSANPTGARGANAAAATSKQRVRPTTTASTAAAPVTAAATAPPSPIPAAT